jgi:hypothetical protein
MGSPNKIDNATPVLTGPTENTEDKVSATQTHYNAMKASTDWTAATDVQTAANDWLAVATNLSTNEQAIADLMKQLAAKRVAEVTLLVQWATQKDVCLAAVRKFCAGSSAKVQGFGYAVAGRTPRPPAPVPSNLLGKRVKVAGTAWLTWTGDAYRRQYQAQWATDSTNPATFSAPRTVGGRSFKLPGQTSGATLHFRVLALDPRLPTGQTDWSPWAAVVVS